MKVVAAVLAAILALGVLMYVYTAPVQPPEMSEAEIAEIEVAVEAVGDQWLAALNAIDPVVLYELFDPTGTHGVDGGYYANYEDWVAHVEALFRTWEEVDIHWVNTRVEVLGPDAALFVGENEGVVTRTSGAVRNFQGGITLLMKKKEGLWKITFQGSAGRWTPVEEG